MLDFKNVNRYSIKNRKSFVNIRDFGKKPASFPNNINREDFDDVVKTLKLAKKQNKQIIWGIGAHVIKCGMSPYVIKLIRNGFVTCIATNGAASIHDSEIALFGVTSEDVATGIKDGSFGFCEETGKFVNNAINKNPKNGYGKSIGEDLIKSKAKYIDYSIFANAVKQNIPITVHVAIGTDITHMHPECNGSSLGEASYTDFKIFCDCVSKLEDGVYLNIGSAVILPEVFLKAVSIARNLGNKIENFTTVGMDFLKQYRVEQNVVKRPGGKGYSIIGNHENIMPFLANELLK